MGSKAKRAGWLFMATLFVVTGLGVGIWGFWQATHPPDESELNIKCSSDSKIVALQVAGSGLKDTKLPNFTPPGEVTKLQCIDGVVGNGAVANPLSTITVHYTGALATNGEIFESSLDSGQPVTLSLGQVIEGWSKGIPGMKVGSTRRLLVPSEMAYGSLGSCEKVSETDPTKCEQYSIPPNTPLVFDITLINAQ
jgi:hypothetical protein